MALDLGGAVPDPLQPGVAPQALDRDLLHESHAAVNLHGAVGSPVQRADYDPLPVRASTRTRPASIRRLRIEVRTGRIARRLRWLREYRCGRCRVRCRCESRRIAIGEMGAGARTERVRCASGTSGSGTRPAPLVHGPRVTRPGASSRDGLRPDGRRGRAARCAGAAPPTASPSCTASGARSQ